MIIRFYFLEVKVSLRERTKLKLFINELFDKEGFNLGLLTYIFCSDRYLLKLNREFLKHDYYTDILTFDLSSTSPKKEGEIYISVDRIRENAKRFDNNFKTELHRVIFHGALHLSGYMDKNASQKKQMRRKEDYYLNLYFK